MEWKLFEGSSFVSTAEFHKDREAVAHIEQSAHIPRMQQTAWSVRYLVRNEDIHSIVDLGAGDGGMLSLLKDLNIPAYGYDFQPANIIKAAERGVDVRFVNFVEDEIDYADVAICTEVIEHLEDPHDFLKRLSPQVKWLICSSPQNETDTWHAPEHAWAFDLEGYRTMLIEAGFFIEQYYDVWPFQLYLCRSDHNV